MGNIYNFSIKYKMKISDYYKNRTVSQYPDIGNEEYISRFQKKANEGYDPSGYMMYLPNDIFQREKQEFLGKDEETGEEIYRTVYYQVYDKSTNSWVDDKSNPVMDNTIKNYTISFTSYYIIITFELKNELIGPDTSEYRNLSWDEETINRCAHAITTFISSKGYDNNRYDNMNRNMLMDINSVKYMNSK